ncbi:hypothetical protein PSEHALCIP103_01477 [Pseudoalteromonas haloplanktis]|uniref:Uncharacterized protein n=1 Tax=Pseudoalteromonas haloplanktis TaxID=228 RepID=A0A9W4QX32_PSEHA|nr:hypothetical protein PSEHALCIP103_01477 [Pseudoalteromonas haloplanktis]
MFLVRLIYASKISSGFGPKDIEKYFTKRSNL